MHMEITAYMQFTKNSLSASIAHARKEINIESTDLVLTNYNWDLTYVGPKQLFRNRNISNEPNNH